MTTGAADDDLAALLRRGERRRRLPAPTDRLRLGPHRVGPLCLGYVRDPRTIAHAVSRGVNFFFLSCDLHWPTYRRSFAGLRQVLRRRPSLRADMCIAVASYVGAETMTESALADLLDELPELEAPDVLVAGGVYGHDAERRIAMLEELRAVGRCRAIGASFHERAAAKAFLSDTRLDVGFVRYNPAHVGARRDLFPFLRPGRPPLFGFTSTTGHLSPARFRELGFAAGMWRPTHADHYRFALTTKSLAGVLFAPQTPAELDVALDALDEPALGVEEEEHMVALVVRDVEALTAERRRAPTPRRPSKRTR